MSFRERGASFITATGSLWGIGSASPTLNSTSTKSRSTWPDFNLRSLRATIVPDCASPLKTRTIDPGQMGSPSIHATSTAHWSAQQFSLWLGEEGLCMK